MLVTREIQSQSTRRSPVKSSRTAANTDINKSQQVSTAGWEGKRTAMFEGQPELHSEFQACLGYRVRPVKQATKTHVQQSL